MIPADVLFGVLYLLARSQWNKRSLRSCETFESGFADAESPPLTDRLPADADGVKANADLLRADTWRKKIISKRFLLTRTKFLLASILTTEKS